MLESGPAFIGRERELAALEAGLAQAAAGSGHLALIVGEPGIGKSILVDIFAARATDRGARVLWGAAWEDGGAPAYWPWVQVLRSLAPDLADSSPTDPRLAPLARLLPAMAEPGTRPEGGEGERFALFDAVVGLLESVSRSGPLVLILEDLHAAGVPTALLLQFVAQHTRGHPVLLVATYREVEARLAPGLGEVVATLEGMGDLLALPPMSEQEVHDLVSPVIPSVTVDVVAAILDRTRGNPLFVTQVARLLAAGTPDTARLDEAPIPAGIVQAVRQRLDRLDGHDELSRRSLTVSAVIGGDVAPEEAAPVLGTSTDEFVEALEPAVRAGLLLETGPQRYRFSHALVREAIHGDLDPSERAALHRRIATVLTSRGSTARDHARLAHHLHAALPRGDPQEAVRHATAAGDEAMDALAYEEAVTNFHQALSALHHVDGDQTVKRGELLLALGDALLRAGALDRAQEVLVQATDHARRTGRADLLGRAALLRTKHLTFHVVDNEAISLLEEAIGAQEDSGAATLAHLHAQLAFALQHDDPDRMQQAAEQAVTAAHRSDDPAAMAAARSMRLYAQWGRHEPRVALTEAEDLVRLTQRTGDADNTATAHMWRFTLSLELGDVDAAKAALEDMTELAERSHQPAIRFLATSRASSLAALTGDLDEALRQANRSLRIGVQAQLPDAEGVHWAQLFAIWRHRKLPAEHEARMERMLRSVVIHSAQDITPEPALVLVELAHGDRTGATARFDALANTVPNLRHDMYFAWNLAMLAEGCVALGATAHADGLHAVLEPFAGRFADASGVICMGAVDHYLAGLSALAGRREDAERLYRAAIDLHRRAGALPMLARSHDEYARLTGAGGPTGNATPAVGTASPTGRRAPADAAPATPAAEFRRSGRVWQLQWEGTRATVGDTKGMRDLAALLAVPGREVSALDLVEAAGGPSAASAGGHAGERLDHTARTAYRKRLESLEDELAEAERNADVDRVAALRQEQEFLAAELAGAIGLGGRPRREGEPAERARKAVTMRIRTALRRIAEVSPGLARHLDRSVSTGRLCAYRPEHPVHWHL